MGSAIGQIVIGPKNSGKGAFIGGIAGTIPDLDVIPLIGTCYYSVNISSKYYAFFIILYSYVVNIRCYL